MIARRSLADLQSHKRICSNRRKRAGSSRRERGGGTYLQDSDWFSGGCFEAGENYKGCLLKPVLLSSIAYGPIHPASDKGERIETPQWPLVTPSSQKADLGPLEPVYAPIKRAWVEFFNRLGSSRKLRGCEGKKEGRACIFRPSASIGHSPVFF